MTGASDQESGSRSALPSLRAATRTDAGFMLQTERICMEDYARAVFGGWHPRPSIPDWFPSGTTIIVKDGEDIGLYSLSRHPGHIQLEQFYILPEHRNAGLGSRILTDLQSQAAKADRALRLRVLVSNPARRFYERAGFTIYETSAERFYMEWHAPNGNGRTDR